MVDPAVVENGASRDLREERNMYCWGLGWDAQRVVRSRKMKVKRWKDRILIEMGCYSGND